MEIGKEERPKGIFNLDRGGRAIMKGSANARIVEVTPDLAQKWLNEKNTHNRPMYERVVETYALDMKRGKWAFNHQGICFNDDGVLDDGQHRLAAIVRSGKTIPFWVFRGMPRTQGSNGDTIITQDTIDDIRKRSIGDRLHLSYGIDNANLKAAMCNVIVLICGGGAFKLSAAMVREIYTMYHKEIDAVVTERGNTRGLVVAPALGAFAFAAACFKDKALEFEKGYFSGASLAPHCPILAYRNYMLKRSVIASKDYGRHIMASHALNAMMHHILGNHIKKLVQTRQGIDFFVNKQKKAYNDLIELLRL